MFGLTKEGPSDWWDRHEALYLHWAWWLRLASALCAPPTWRCCAAALLGRMTLVGKLNWAKWFRDAGIDVVGSEDSIWLFESR